MGQVVTLNSPAQQVTVMALRKRLHTSGYRPVAVRTAEKRPYGNNWLNRARLDPPEASIGILRPDVLNTGILCDGLRAVDIDVDDSSVASQVEMSAIEMLGLAPVRVRADSSRCLILYRAAEGEPGKLAVEGSYGKIEVLGFGQQFVAYGIHPGGQLYQWRPSDPAPWHRDTLIAVTDAQIYAFLTAVAPLIGADPPKRMEQINHGNIGQDDLPTGRERAYAAKALKDECVKLSAMKPNSGRNQALNNAALRSGEMIAAGWIDRTQAEDQLWEASRINGYRAKDGDAAAWASLQSGLKAGMKNPRLSLAQQPILPGILDFIKQGHAHFFPSSVAAPNSQLPLGDRAVTRRVADVRPERVRWLWPGRIANGKLSIIAGDPGVAKSQLTLFIAATVTNGAYWPNNEGQAPIGNVLLLSCEDDIADTIRPRLEVAEADLSRVHVLEAIKQIKGGMRGFNLTTDLKQLEEELDRIGGLTLIIIDPVSAYLGGTDTHRNADVRAVLAPLQEMASRRGIAVVAVSHFNKSAGQGKSINAITGSGAFVAASRSTFVVTKDNNNPELRLLLQAKNNLANAPGLSFRTIQGRTKDGITAPFVRFEIGTVSLTADEAIGQMGATGARSAIDEAKAFLEEELSQGAISANELMQRANEAGISEKTLRRAQSQIGVKPRKSEFGGGWVWSLPEPKMANTPEDGQQKKLDIFATEWPSSGLKRDD
jgi:hypothetical protein